MRKHLSDNVKLKRQNTKSMYAQKKRKNMDLNIM